MTYTGKNVLITGASKGIGKAIALKLAKEGLKVWINYRNDATKAQELLQLIQSQNGQAAIIAFDATNEEEFTESLKAIISCDEELSYLVNNAGITKDKLAIRMKKSEFDEVLNANLSSAFIGCREALKLMSKKRFGAVVNIASIVGETGNIGQTNYSASKGGMIAMSKSFALEGSSREVRFNCITPGFIATDMTDKLSEEIKQNYINSIPLKRLGSAEDIANGVAFLLSDEASYITGETLKINGGMYM